MKQEKIGKFIAELRKEKKMTQDDLAKFLHIDRSIVSKWERGLYIPKHDIILKLSNLFDVSVNEVYYGERQNDENKEKVNEVTINIIENNEKKSKKIILGSLMFIILLIMSFLIYYFINNYKSIVVYKVSGESENFGIYDGIIVFSREKSYIQLGNIQNFTDYVIQNVKLYYKKDNKDYTIFANNSDDLSLYINNFSHSESFSYDDFKYVKNNLYLAITYGDNKTETLILTVQKDFTNNNIFSPVNKKIADDEVIEFSNDVPMYIKKNFKFDPDEEKYYLESNSNGKKVVQKYYINARLYVVEEIYDNREIQFEYFLPNDISYDVGDNNVATYIVSENKCTSSECDMDIINYFINEYISKINFEI